jgi:diguanylate cyclase (GGDEF)-like protein
LVVESSSELNCRHFTTPPPAYACLPLSSHGELLGLLHVQHAQSAETGKRDGQETWPALKTAAEQISLALANLGIREALREQATHDKLTGLYNRHYLHARFEQEIVRARRHKSSAAIILLDIDHFKRINDTFGHAAGDHVLRELGVLLLGAGRKSDIPCRFGGEEFLLLMPDATCAVAKKRAHAILAAVRSLRLDWEGRALGVITVSAGISVFPAHGENPEALTRAADLALYRAKELGRDRVVEATLGSPVAEH